MKNADINEQLSNLVKLYKKSNDEKYLEQIMQITKPLVYHVINKYKNDNWQFESIDYYQMIMMHYPQWINKFKESSHCKFSTYLYTCIRNKLMKIIRKENSQKRKTNIAFYFDQQIMNSDYGTYADVISDSIDYEQTYINNLQRQKLYYQLQTLFGKRAQLYIAYLQGYRYDMIAKLFDLDENEVKKEISKMKKVIKTKANLFHNK